MKKRALLIIIFLTFFFLCSSAKASNVGLIENATWQSNLTAVQWSSLAFGDIDNDGDLDLVVSGCTSFCESSLTKIYINNGTTLVENSTWQGNLTGISWGSFTFGDIDNDNDLDLALTGCLSSGSTLTCDGQKIAKIYTNNGTTLQENSAWQQNLTAISDSSIAFGDIDNDGDLDLVTIGNSIHARVYINNGTSLIENSTWQSNLTSVYHGNIAWGDVDNDGDLDLALTGETESSTDFTKLYINNGTSLIENSTWGENLANMDRSSIIWADYDNDGDLDLALVGHTTGDHFYLYNNNGSTLLLNQTRDDGCLPGVYRNFIAFGDYDNDGDLDLVGMGHEAGRGRTCENNEANNYYFQSDATSHANISDYILRGALAFGDIDNDGDLDLVIVGNDYYAGFLAKVYINNITTPNTPPNASTSFSSSFVNGRLTLTWGNGSDAETPTNGLYYNLRVGTSSGGNNIVSGVYGGSSGGSGGTGAGAAGYFGNMMQHKSISLSGLSPSTTYYWSIQTIDTGLRKSNWSTEQNYTTQANIVDPVITLNSPVNLYNTTNATIVFNVNVTDDSGLANVSLWGNWSGWHRNETNSTNLVNGTYTFSKNLSSYGDGFYIWAIRACDTYSNCIFSSNRTFMIDNANPNVSLISPSHASTWTSSSTVTFTYNVSDLAIANCSLIIDNAIVETDSSIAVNTNQEFSRSLSNAAYTWSINCTDFTNHTANSTTRSLTINYVAPPSGGGGGGAAGPITYNIGALTTVGTTKQVAKDDSIKFKVNETEQIAKITTITSSNVTLNLSNIIFALTINETKKLDMNNDSIYDTSITLNTISDNKASLTLKSISEAVPAEAPKEEEKPEEEEVVEKEKVSEEKRKPIWIPITLTILIAACFAYYFWKKGRKKK